MENIKHERDRRPMQGAEHRKTNTKQYNTTHIQCNK